MEIAVAIAAKIATALHSVTVTLNRELSLFTITAKQYYLSWPNYCQCYTQDCLLPTAVNYCYCCFTVIKIVIAVIIERRLAAVHKADTH